MERRSIVKIAALLIGVPLLLLAIVLLYLKFADLSGWRDTVAGFISESLGRELTINGVFEPEIGLTTHVTAGDIALANVEWGSEPTMASIDHLEVEVRLLSLLFGPIDIRRLEVDGVRVLLEADGEGRANWESETADEDEEDTEPLGLALGQIDLSDVEFLYRDPSLDQPLAFGAAKLSIRGDDDMLAVQLDGHFNHNELGLRGRLGPLAGLLQSRNVEHDLSGHLGGIDFSSRGRIAELTTLGGAALEINIHGTELTAVGEVFDLAGLEPVPFQVDLGVTPATAGSALTLGASAGEMTAAMTGTVDSLIEPRVLDVSVEASGPNVATVGTLSGVQGLPADPFSAAGHIRWEGFPITCNNLEVRVGDNTLSADGVLGEPPLMMGTDFTFDGKGPDVSSLAGLVGVSLPKDSFSVGGRLVRQERGIKVEKVEARVGQTTFEVDGSVGDPPEYAGTALSIRGGGPNLAHFQSLAGIALPAERFEVDGKLVQGEGAINLEMVRARLGRNTLRVDGLLTTAPGFAGTDLRLNARGPNASQLASIANISDVPAEPYSVKGRVTVLKRGYRVSDLAATLGSLAVTATGFVAPPPTLLGSDLQIHVEDSDLSHPASIAGITDLPHDAFKIDTRVRIEESGYRLDNFGAAVGDMELEVDGLIGAPPELDETQVHITAHGPKLASLNQFLDQTELPAAPFSVSGNAHITGGAYVLAGVVAEVDGNRVTLDGTVHPTAGLVGTDLEIAVSAPDLARAGRLAAGFAELPALPAERFTLDTGLEIEEHGYRIENLRATLANAAATIDGRVGSPPELVGTDLTIDSDGPNASLFTALTGVTIPVAPFRIRGRFQRTAAGYQFDRVSIQLGDYLADVHGSVGEPPRLVGTDVELRASGPRVALVGELAGLEHMPDEAFRVGGRFKGTPELFTTDGLEIAIGDSDLSGSLEVDIRGKPAAIVNLKSKHLDLSPFMKPLLGGGDGDQDEEVASSRGTGGTAISNEPIDFGPLQRADADVTIKIGTLLLPLKRFREVELGARLSDGRLEVHRFSVVGQREDRGSGTLVLEPVGDDYRLHTVLDFDALRLDLPGEGSADPASEPPIDLDVRLDVVGKSPHGFASTADGSVQMVVGKGVWDDQILDLITADILLTLLNAFNPFAKEDAATELQCAVFLVSLEDGLAILEPMALQSDKMTMLGKGKIDFGTEKLDLEWITKPRKGIGISASMITNPYIKLGGTLSNPSVQMKGMEAVASTGAAVATMGISLVAKGFLDRITAEKKVCKKALKEIESRSHGRPK